MDASPTALLTTLLPALPSLLLTAFLAVLGWTANSAHQDAITQIIVAGARPILRTPAHLERSQRVWRRLGRWAGWGMVLMQRMRLGWILGVDGVVWQEEVVRIMEVAGKVDATSGSEEGDGTCAEEDESEGKVLSVCEAVAFVFDELRDPKHESMACPIPELADVEVEWTVRQHATKCDADTSNPFSDGVSHEKHGLLANLTPVILYLHGGAHCLMDPTTHRWTTSTLSKLSGADVCAVRFRLSPQHPFPAALVDGFVAYLALLHPGSTSTHRAIETSRIVLAGDSSGGGLAASLFLLLLTLSRHKVSVMFNGERISIPSPPCAGLALISPWLDITRSLPSTSRNDKWDIIAPPPIDSASPPFPADEIWPTIPPRAETYCDAEMCIHPLMSPLAASSSQWAGAPPVWVCSGWEGFTDEIEVFARRVYQSSSEAKVWFEGWEGMPHCFGMVPWNWAGWEAMRGWAGFCSEVVSCRLERRHTAVWRGTVGRNKGVERTVMMDELGCESEGVGYKREVELSDGIVDELMEKGRSWRMGLEREMVGRWKAGGEEFRC